MEAGKDVKAPELHRSDAIRLAALKLFAEHGYESTTIDQIGSAAGIRGPSIYRHFSSKQELLFGIMLRTVRELIAMQKIAETSCDEVVLRLRRMIEAHVRYHTRHKLEAFVGNRELRSLNPENYEVIRHERRNYELGVRNVLELGVATGEFHVESPMLTSFALMDLGVGISAWYRDSGRIGEDLVVSTYGDFALRLVGARIMVPSTADAESS